MCTIEELHVYLAKSPKFHNRARRHVAVTAYHEAGHAVATAIYGGRFDWVAVRPSLIDGRESNFMEDDELLGPFTYGRVFEENALRVFEIMSMGDKWTIHLLAGPLAEARFLNRQSRILGGDRTSLYEMVYKLASGMGIHAYVREMKHLMMAFLDSHCTQVKAVAEALIEKRRLTYREVRAIIRSAAPS
jgi:hypothetical protein